MKKTCELRMGYHYGNSDQRRLGYRADRSDLHVYALDPNAGGDQLSYRWIVEDYRDEKTGEQWIMLAAAGTAREGMPDNPTAEQAWAHLPLYLCLIGNDIVLSGTGVVRDTWPEIVIPTEAGRWRVRDGNFDSRGKTVVASWLESVAYPGGYLTYNQFNGATDFKGPLGLSHEPNENAVNAMSWVVSELAPQPA